MAKAEQSVLAVPFGMTPPELGIFPEHHTDGVTGWIRARDIPGMNVA